MKSVYAKKRGRGGAILHKLQWLAACEPHVAKVRIRQHNKSGSGERRLREPKNDACSRSQWLQSCRAIVIVMKARLQLFTNDHERVGKRKQGVALNV